MAGIESLRQSGAKISALSCRKRAVQGRGESIAKPLEGLRGIVLVDDGETLRNAIKYDIEPLNNSHNRTATAGE